MEDYNSVYKHIQICIGQFTKIGYKITQNNSQIIVNMPAFIQMHLQVQQINAFLIQTLYTHKVTHIQPHNYTHTKDNIADSS